MVGNFSDIWIVAVSSAKEGDIVEIEARIKNLCDYAISLTATIGRVNSEVLHFGAIHKIVGSGQTEYWYDSFVMPNEDVVVSVESWYKGTDNIWHSDDRDEKVISLTEIVAKFTEFGISSFSKA